MKTRYAVIESGRYTPATFADKRTAENYAADARRFTAHKIEVIKQKARGEQ
jgi:hypothetical protein